MNKFLISVAAAALLSPVAMAAQSKEKTSEKIAAPAQDRKAVFDKIDTNNDKTVTQTEFRTYVKNERSTESAIADKVFGEIAGDKKEITLADFEKTPVLTAWYGAPAMVDASGDTTKKAEMKASSDKTAMVEKAVEEKAEMAADKATDAVEMAAADKVAEKTKKPGDVMKAEKAATSLTAPTTVTTAAAAKDVATDATVAKTATVEKAEAMAAEKATDMKAEVVKEASEKTAKVAQESAEATPPTLAKLTPVASQEAALQKRADEAMEKTFKKIDENGDGQLRKAEYLEFVRAEAEKRFDKMAGRDKGVTMTEFMKSDDAMLRSASKQ